MDLISGTTNKTPVGADEAKDFMYAGGGMGRIRIQASGQNDEGTFGAWIRMGADGWGGDVSGHGLAWWKPIDMLRLQIGSNPDGEFGLDGVARWGFYQDACDVGVANETWAWSASFYGGFDAGGSIVTLTPVDGLEINVAVPFDSGSSDPVPGYSGRFIANSYTGFLYDKTTVQAKYGMEGLGTFGLTFIGGRGTELDNGAKLLLYAGLDLIEGLGIDIGLGYTLPGKKDGVGTYNAPIALGLGAQYAITDEFGVKFRAQGEFAGKMKPDSGDSEKDAMVVRADVMPFYAVSESMTAFLSVGLVYTGKEKDQGMDSNFIDWHLNPYIAIKEGNGGFYAGIKIYGNGERKYVNGGKVDSYIDWSIPIAVSYAF